MQKMLEVRELATSIEELTGINAQDEKDIALLQLTTLAGIIERLQQNILSDEGYVDATAKDEGAAEEWGKKAYEVRKKLEEVAHKIYLTQDIIRVSACKGEVLQQVKEELAANAASLLRIIALADLLLLKDTAY